MNTLCTEMWYPASVYFVLIENSSQQSIPLLLWTPSPRGGAENSSTRSRVPEEGAHFPINSQRNLCMWRLTREDLDVWSGNASPITATTKPKTNIFTMTSTWHPILKINHPHQPKWAYPCPSQGPLQGSILFILKGTLRVPSNPPVVRISPPVSQGAPESTTWPRPWEGMASEWRHSHRPARWLGGHPTRRVLRVRLKDHFLVQSVLSTPLDNASAVHRALVGAQAHSPSMQESAGPRMPASLATPLPPLLSRPVSSYFFMCSPCFYFWMFFLLQDANLSLKARLYQWGLG